mmetsp:Transcript_18721/g.30565  ORF Transcript_18721/g.30565 Transcript_18721/m.30565 type:complete len:388 (+) Transcript_18721:2796-3959(+)
MSRSTRFGHSTRNQTVSSLVSKKNKKQYHTTCPPREREDTLFFLNKPASFGMFLKSDTLGWVDSLPVFAGGTAKGMSYKDQSNKRVSLPYEQDDLVHVNKRAKNSDNIDQPINENANIQIEIKPKGKEKEKKNAKKCRMPGCHKFYRSGSRFCVSHGGGRRCNIDGCTKSAQGSTNFCSAHGGGKRCQYEGCKKGARGRSQFCIAHGSQIARNVKNVDVGSFGQGHIQSMANLAFVNDLIGGSTNLPTTGQLSSPISHQHHQLQQYGGPSEAEVMAGMQQQQQIRDNYMQIQREAEFAQMLKNSSAEQAPSTTPSPMGYSNSGQYFDAFSTFKNSQQQQGPPQQQQHDHTLLSQNVNGGDDGFKKELLMHSLMLDAKRGQGPQPFLH